MTSGSPPVARPVTPTADWAAALRARRPRPFDPTAHQRVVVLAAHPDDETLGAGGCLRALHRAGAEVSVVVATDGEAAFPALDAAGRRALAGARRAELDAALTAQGVADVPVRWLGLPDSGLAGRGAELRSTLAPLLAAADAYVAPWAGDPHPDHRAVALAAADAAPVTTHGWGYPIWMWAWLAADDPTIPWDHAYLFELDDAALQAKRAGVAAFVSQVAPGPDGSPPVVGPAELAHLTGPSELLFRVPRGGSAPLSRFATLYADGADPWSGDSWYERRKRAVVLASLPRERYRTAFEPGCGTGELTSALAGRCDTVLASEPVPDAARRARDRTADLPGVRVDDAALPDAVPEGPVDLAVFSEVLYYLDDATVRATIDRTLAALRPGGDVVAVHWRGWPAEAPRDAVATHEMLRGRPDLVDVVDHVDADFVLLVLRRR